VRVRFDRDNFRELVNEDARQVSCAGADFQHR
jgi:hypothetical protein